MTALRQLERELGLAELFALVVLLGYALSSDTLALFGCIGVIAVLFLEIWQHYCLAGVAFRHHLERPRARFGEHVGFEVEIVNDKLLPLSYLKIEDEVPADVHIEGATLAGTTNRRDLMLQVLPLMPYQRVRRHFSIHCDRRGDYLFGPTSLTSGDPIGRRIRSLHVHTAEHLLVYPKILQLVPKDPASRVLLGTTRTSGPVPPDPSRIAGVRAYQGDPLRHVNWRASARAGELLVHRFEPTASARVVVVFNALVPEVTMLRPDSDELEFAVSITASVVSDLAQRRIPVGLFTTGLAGGRNVGHSPSEAPNALPAMLESLAKLDPFGSLSADRLLLSVTERLSAQTSVIVISAEFSQRLMTAVSHVRRRRAVSAVGIGVTGSLLPPRSAFDAYFTASYLEDWKQNDAFELAV